MLLILTAFSSIKAPAVTLVDACAEWRKLPRTSQGTPPSCPSMTNDLSTSEDLIAKQLCQDISTRFLFPFKPFSLGRNYTNTVYTKLYLTTVNQNTQEHTDKSSQ